jgi:hypothetical protein
MTIRVVALVALVACWHGAAPSEPSSVSSGGATAQPPPPPPPTVSMVTSMVIIEACPDSKHFSAVRARQEIEELVGPCTKVPGGGAHFAATLRPDGSVELTSPSGDPKTGIVPTCLLQTRAQLRHKLRLTKPCMFDVKLEERGH